MTGPEDPTPPGLAQWREDSLREQGHIILWLGALPVAYIFAHHLLAGRPWIGAFVVLFLVAIPVVLIKRLLSFRTRALILAGLFFAASVGSFITLGVVGGATLAMVCAAVVASLMVGHRAGWWVLGLSVLAMVGAALAHVTGLIAPPGIAEATDPTVAGNWIRTLAFFVLCGGSVVLLVMFLTRRVEEGLAESATLVGTLREQIRERESADEARALAETRLAQAQKMEAIGLLASGVAHDFNNILAAVQGHAEVALDGEQPCESVEGILEASTRGRQLAERLLAFAREGDEAQETLDLGLLAEETVRLVRAALARTVAVELHLPEAPAVVSGSAAELNQLLVNLCANAGQAMPEGGHLAVTLEIGERDGAEVVTLTVEDTGVGMDAATLDRAFEPYFTTRRGSGGTGLGLAVVHGVVQRHHGELEVASVAGEGTRFTIHLPRAQWLSPVRPPVRLHFELPEDLSVLLVDDDRMVRRAMASLLVSMGTQVHVAEGGERALEVLAQHPVDVLVTDETMPGMSGMELVEIVRREHLHLPVVLCTGDAGAVSERDLAALRVGQICQKPVSANELRWAMVQAMSTSRSRSRS